MARTPSRTLTEAELEYMDILWRIGEAAPDDVMESLADKGRPVTGGTVRNVLLTLMEKGYVKRAKHGKAYHYSARLKESEAKRSLVLDLLDRAFQGSESGLVATLFNGRDIDTDELAEIRRMIDRHDKEDTK